MVNASLNWASIVGIVLAVCGAGLYFMRSFKPALARDYDVFFAAIGLLCGGILFFQGWRLDPILQFGQFLLAGTTVFFGYESVRLRGVATDQARKSSYFDEDPASPRMPGGNRFNNEWEDQYNNFDQFDESNSRRRRFSGRVEAPENDLEEDSYRPRRSSRAAIPERAASRRSPRSDNSWDENPQRSRRLSRFNSDENDADITNRSDFGERRVIRQTQRRGSRPTASTQGSRSRSTRDVDREEISRKRDFPSKGIPRGTPIDSEAEDATFSPLSNRKNISRARSVSRESTKNRSQSSNTSMGSPTRTRPRDNTSRFDD